MQSACKNIFFLGKGGVGKSTVSALFALKLAAAGSKVILASLDPAHNQSDIFNMKFSEKAKTVTQNLLVKEIDTQSWIKKYLNGVQEKVESSYKYLTAFNLEGYFDIIKHSPGIEEYALLMAYQDVVDENTKVDYILFDMPPTALATKFFGLPGLSLKWTQKLIELRNQILEKRAIVSRIRFGKTEFETDKVLKKLETETQFYSQIYNTFKNPSKTEIKLVINQDLLSISESRIINETLSKMGLNLHALIINKHDDNDSSDIRSMFSGLPVVRYPASSVPLIGISNLNNYLKNHF